MRNSKNIVFSDLDGTFLDHDNYRFQEAVEGYRLLVESDISLIFVSSKTFDEMVDLAHMLSHYQPFIFENGGGIGRYSQMDELFHYELTGASYRQLVSEKHLLTESIHCSFDTFDDISSKEIALRTGLSVQQAERAKNRLASLPFFINSETEIDIKRINSYLETYDRMCTKGGRLYHFSSRESTKGKAVQQFIDEAELHINNTMAVGDSLNDIPMLERVGHAYLVRRADGTHIDTDDSSYKRTNGKGPAGFTEAVKDFLERLQ